MSENTSPIYRIIMLLLAAVLAVAGWLLSQAGFNSIQNLHQMERIGQTSIAAALTGEVKLNATVAKLDSLLTSEHFKVPSVYYAYRYEEEETDSDGDRYWSTKHQSTDRVNFLLRDESGQLVINHLQLSDHRLNYSLPISQQIVVGDRRYTEWRIEPGDRLFVFGMLQTNDNIAQVGFIQAGQYLPIISKFGENHEKSELGLAVVLMVCGGISLIAFAAFALTSGLQIHRIIAFLLMLSFATLIPLLHLGATMLHQDIVAANQQLMVQSERALSEINQTVDSYAYPQDNWPDLLKRLQTLENRLPITMADKVSGIQVNLVYAQEKYAQQLTKFPNNLIAWLYSIKPVRLFELLDLTQQNQVATRLQNFKQAQTSGMLPIVIGGAGLLLCIGLSWFGFRLIRLKRHIENLTTSKTSGLVFGLSELKGRITKIDPEEPLTSPLTHTPCYWYHYRVAEKQGSGKDAKWVEIENRQQHQVFNCKDAYGEIKVNPKNAEIISRHSKTKTRGRLKYSETVLKLNDKIYLLGLAKIDRDKGDTLEIRGDKKERPFLITNLTERAVMLRKANGGMLSLTVAFSALIFAALFYLGNQGSFAPTDYLLAALIAPVYMSVLVLILHYNDLIFLKQRASRNFSNIKVSMQKRFDLLPNLEKIVKKYLTHEAGLLNEITALRAQPVAQNDLTEITNQLQSEQQVLSQIFARAEDYPQLKAQQLNVKLMNKLVDLENEIALMREGYNDAVTYYNTRIASVPDVFFARFFRFKSMDLFNYQARKFSKVVLEWD